MTLVFGTTAPLDPLLSGSNDDKIPNHKNSLTHYVSSG